MKSKISLVSVLSTLVLMLCMMSQYKIFTGQSRSVTWYFLFYGKYFLIMIVILVSWTRRAKSLEVRKRKRWIEGLLLTPTIIIFLYSLLLWLFQGSSFGYISRGISDIISKVLAIYGGISFVYLLKERIIKCTLIAALITYTISLIIGFSKNPNELISAILSRGGQYISGSYNELHEVAFILGLYVLFIIFMNNDGKYVEKPKMAIFLSCICILIAWKRIEIFALILCIIYFIIIDKLGELYKFKIISITGTVLIVFCLLYVSLSVSSSLVTLMEVYNINLMGRGIIYKYFRQFCDFKLSYFGQGVGFVSKQFDFTTAADLYNMSRIKALHNDFLKIYIEIGFFWFFALGLVLG